MGAPQHGGYFRLSPDMNTVEQHALQRRSSAEVTSCETENLSNRNSQSSPQYLLSFNCLSTLSVRQWGLM